MPVITRSPRSRPHGPPAYYLTRPARGPAKSPQTLLNPGAP
jgi:hypothetical protein